MEEINKAKQATQEIFQQFQDNYFARVENNEEHPQWIDQVVAKEKLESFNSIKEPIIIGTPMSIKEESQRGRSAQKISKVPEPSAKKPLGSKPDMSNKMKSIVAKNEVKSTFKNKVNDR